MDDFFSFFKKKRRKDFTYTPESDIPIHEHYTKQGPIQRISEQETNISKKKITKKKR